MKVESSVEPAEVTITTIIAATRPLPGSATEAVVGDVNLPVYQNIRGDLAQVQSRLADGADGEIELREFRFGW